MSKGDVLVAYLRYGPPTLQIEATKDGRSVKKVARGKLVKLQEVTRTGVVVREIDLAADAVIAVVPENSKRRR
jgi:hypothetical protein